MKIILVIIIVLMCSCQSQQRSELKKSQEDSTQNKNNRPPAASNSTAHSFIDSILCKDEISIDQIKKHTLLDSFYYTGMHSNASFTGDTIFTFSKEFKGGIIKYNDATNCILKFLLIFKPPYNINTDSKIIYTDCDQDESANYTTLRYDLMNDSTFKTIETDIPASVGKQKIKPTIETIKWKLTEKGIIDSIH